MRASVVILTKLPGHMPIKTRLHGLLGQAGAEEFYRHCLRETVETAEQFCWQPILATSPYDVDPAAVLPEFTGCRMEPVEGDNGAVCLENAMRFADVDKPIVALGGDAPDLPPSRIEAALDALADHDAAFVPTPDGGFSCMALRKSLPGLARGFSYGGGDALDALQGWMEARGMRVARVQPWPDIDTPDDHAAYVERDRVHADETRRIHERGLAALDADAIDEALRAARELEQRRFSGAFELGALAHLRNGNVASAVELLERGVRKDPDEWSDWQLLGNCRSDLGEFDGAEEAYERALQCPDVSLASIHLNRATVAQRRGESAQAHRLLDLVDDPDLALAVEVQRLALWIEEERWEDVRVRSGRVLEELGDEVPEDETSLGWVLAARARALHAAGERYEALECALAAYGFNLGDDDLLGVIREVEGRSASGTRMYRLFCLGSDEERDPSLYCVSCDVAADSQEEALGYVAAIEATLGGSDVFIEAWEDLGAHPDLLQGVYVHGMREFYLGE